MGSWWPSWLPGSHPGGHLGLLVAILGSWWPSWWPSWPPGSQFGLLDAILASWWPSWWPSQAVVSAPEAPSSAPSGFSLPFPLPPQDPGSPHADDVDPGPPAGRNPSAGPLSRPRPFTGRHVGPQPRPFARLRTQHDGAQPRPPHCRTPTAPPGARRLRSGQHAPDAQGEDPQNGNSIGG